MHKNAWTAAVREFGSKPTREQLLAAPFVQLYNLANDLAEQSDVSKQHPKVVQQMFALMQQQFNNGRSTPGPRLQNDRATLNYWGRIPPGILAP